MSKKQILIILTLAIFAIIIAAAAVSCAERGGTQESAPGGFTEPTIYITMRSGEVPNEYEAVVSAANNPGIAGYNLALAFDNVKLTPIAINQGDAFNGSLVFISNLNGASAEEIAAMNIVTAVWAAGSDNANDGVLYSVLFRATPDASGQTELTLTSRGIGNVDEQPVDFALLGAVVDFGENAGSAGSRGWIIALIVLILLALVVTIWWIIQKRNRSKHTK
jgi:hypothetical protein